MTWTAISTADNLQFVADDGNPEGTYYCYLTKEIGAPSYSFTFRGAKNVVLCLNGHTITGAEDSSKPVITVEEGKTFTLCDCGGEGQIIQVSQYSQGGVKVEGGTFNLYGGSITNNNAGATGCKGGGVYVESGTFTVSGNANISGNKASATSAAATEANNVYLAGAIRPSRLAAI